MIDKIGATDKIGFVLNGKPIEPGKPPVTNYCPEKNKPEGCQLHNLQCGYPKCNEDPGLINKTGA